MFILFFSFDIEMVRSTRSKLTRRNEFAFASPQPEGCFASAIQGAGGIVFYY